MDETHVKDFPDTPWGRSAQDAFVKLKSTFPPKHHGELKLSVWKSVFDLMLADWLKAFRSSGSTTAELELAHQAFLDYWNSQAPDI